ncbi:MAG: fibronectin type III domain-containing protein [Candidatus Nanopelagicales bacterium]|jgi:hypothetical protein|nr:fibronectin type III domain-containing protein [Candidatus Nanopelagicales bacterium]
MQLPILGVLLLSSTALISLNASPVLAETPPPRVIASSSAITAASPVKSVSVLPDAAIRAVANAPRVITVTARPGTGIMLSSGKSVPIFTRASAKGFVVFRELTPGQTYLIQSMGKDSSRARISVTALTAMRAPTRLTATTTDQRTSIKLTWQYTPTRATGGTAVGFRLTATPLDSSFATITKDVRNVRSMVLTGLSPDARYTFTLTPRNSAGSGKSATATMNRTLAEIHGGNSTSTPTSLAPAADASLEPIKTPVSPNIAEVSTPADANPPAPPTPVPPTPATRTIYVCPDDFAETGDICTQTKAYTYSPVTETTPYTYSTESRYESCSGPDCPGSVYQDFGTDWSGTTCPRGGTMHDGKCLGWTNGNKWVNYQVKDAPPMGWHDDGSAFARVIQVKDAMPAGFADDGTNWIKSASKIARVVPA